MADFEIESDGDEFEASESYSFDAGRRTVSRIGSSYSAPKTNFGAYSSGLGAEDDVYNFDFDEGAVPMKKGNLKSPPDSPEPIVRKVAEKPKASFVSASSESAMEKAQRLLQGSKAGQKQKLKVSVKEFDEDDISVDSDESSARGFQERPLRRSPTTPTLAVPGLTKGGK